MLWHNRLGHMSEKGMKLLHSKKVLPCLKCINIDFYEGCVYRKQKRVSFVKGGKEKEDEKLELVHIDVCGAGKVSSLRLIIMLDLLMIQLEKYVFIFLDINLMYL